MKVVQIWVNEEPKGEANLHEYDVSIDGNEYVVRRSYNSGWVNPGQIACSAVDTGNDLRVRIGNRGLKLSYCEVSELLALLLCSYDGKLELRETKKVI